MRTIITAVALLASISTVSYSVALSARQNSTSAARAEDEAAIRKIVSRIQDGWNKGDGNAFAAPFAEDADYVVINGMRIKGRSGIASGHQQIFDTIYKNSRNAGTVQGIRFLRDDVAVVHVEWHLKIRENDPSGEGRAMNSMIMTKEKGQWSIAAFQNTLISVREK